jgi:hypothetical protein
MAELARENRFNEMEQASNEKRVYNGDVRICTVCGVLKRRTEFPVMRRNKGCRLCCFMKEHNLGWRHCECCGENKPIDVFPQHHPKQGALQRCWSCMNQAVTVAEIV